MKVKYSGQYPKIIPNLGEVKPGEVYNVPSNFNHPEFEKVKNVKNSKKDK